MYDCIFPGSIGGIERRNAELARALADRGHAVTLAGWQRSGGAPDPHPGVAVLPLGPAAPLYDAAGRRRLAAAARFARHCLRLDVRRFDLVETAHVPYLHLLPLALRCALARRPLVVSWYEVWGGYWKRYVGPVRWLPFALVERLAAEVGRLATASSRLTLERLTARRFRNPPRHLACGIDLQRVDAVLRRVGGGLRDTPPEAAGETHPPLLYAGRLLREKRLDLLLEALVHLPPLPAFPEPLLRIVGEGPDRERLAARARELGVAERVELTGRLPSGDDVYAAMARARLAVQPSSREGFGLFALEAMAAGLPVVHCRSPESAVGELVRHGREGLECEPEAGALAAAIERLLTSADERERLARAARLRAETYSWAAVAERAEALFVEALGRGLPDGGGA